MTRRWKATTATVLLAMAGLLGLAGCGTPIGPDRTGSGQTSIEENVVDVAAALGANGLALAALGFDPDDLAPADGLAALAEPATTPGAEPGRAEPRQRERGEAWRERRQARVLLRRNTLHGEAVVKTTEGTTRTVLVQRGAITAVDGESMTVKSTDGFTMTWTFGDGLRVVERRKSVQPEQVEVGTQVGVSGTRDGEQGVARLIVVPRG